MSTIRELFDAHKPIDRRIEKVIQYEGGNDELLKREITEYVVTANIESSFLKLLDQLDEGMSGDTEHEIGIWVSGFYGSGKSSFTKYLGMALDPGRTLNGRAFREWLQDQFTTRPLKARLATVAAKHPMTVFLLDLSTETLVGPTMQSVSTVLYHKVLEWAGYSREKKIAYLELMVDKDKKRAEFEALIAEVSGGETWYDMRNDPMTALTFARKAASRLYPRLWPTPEEFDAVNPDTVETEDERVTRMLRIIRDKGGSANVLFVIDEVGQYVAPVDDRITNLQGLAQNLKRLGHGKAWIVATAQQTLTEDDVRAAVNSPKLYKLKDRFPIWVDLEASDIREICHKRLLSKSPQGVKTLEARYADKGEKLRLLTHLNDAKGYGADLDKGSFVDLYPFLPQHFDILLKILGRLRTTGGVGLRSAIKVVQDVLIVKGDGRVALADAPLGTLATTVWFYDTLRLDLERSVRHAVDGVNRTREVFRGSAIHEQVAKSIAVMQVLEDFPLSRKNLAALMFDSVDAGSADMIGTAIDDLIKTEGVPLTEVDGKLRFMSERVRDLEKQRRQAVPSQSDRRFILVKAAEELFYPQPTVNVHSTKRMSAGLKINFAGYSATVFGEREEVQIFLELIKESGFPEKRKQIVTASREPGSAKTIFALGMEDPAVEETILEIHRSEQAGHGSGGPSPDKEIEDYMTGQRQLAQRLRDRLKELLRIGFLNGVLVFRGKDTAVRTLNADILEAMKSQLAEAGEQVYEKYPHAAVPAESSTAEKFLRTEDLHHISTAADPLGLCSGAGRGRAVNVDHLALVDIREYLDHNGNVDGQKLMEDFGRSPFGWTKDTTRYLLAALFTQGVVKLRVNNQDIVSRSEAAIEAVRNVPKFNKTGIGLRAAADRPDPEALLLASKRLLSITGMEVLPLEENVTRAVQQSFPGLQTQVAPLVIQLRSLSLPGVDRAERLQKSIRDLLSAEASIVKRLGATDSEVFDDITWARDLLKSFENNLADTIGRAQRLRRDIAALPGSGIPGRWKESTASLRADLEAMLQRDDFSAYSAEIQQRVSELEQGARETTKALWEELMARLDSGRSAILALPEWSRISDADRERIGAMLASPNAADDADDLNGLQNAMARQYTTTGQLEQARTEVLRLAALDTSGEKRTRVRMPRVIRTREQLASAQRAVQIAAENVDTGTTVEIELE